jgi:hypothetical protein
MSYIGEIRLQALNRQGKTPACSTEARRGGVYVNAYGPHYVNSPAHSP